MIWSHPIDRIHFLLPWGSRATGIAQHTASQRTPDTAARQHCHFSGHTAKESKGLKMNIATTTLTRKLDISMLRSTFKSIAAEDSFHLTWT